MTDSAVIAGLDIGSHRIRVMLAEYDEDDRLLISGFGESESEGLLRGVVVNVESAHEAVQVAVEAAEQQAGRTITHLLTSLSGPAVDSSNSRGVVPISSKSGEIRRQDIDRAIDAARAVIVPMDREILHVLPQQYIVDDKAWIRNPMDMIGVRLEVEVHIVTGVLSAIQNMEKVVERADYQISEIALGSLAAARALLSVEEKEMGVLMIDIGSSATNYILVQKGAPRLTGSVPVGGELATGDLSIMLKTSIENAEKIKLESGVCWAPYVKDNDSCLLPGIGGRDSREIFTGRICEILQPRIEEIFSLIRNKVEKSFPVDSIAGGLVLSGGSAVMPGMTDLAGYVFNTHARIGLPHQFARWPEDCCKPEWSTVAGLIMLGDAMKTKEHAGLPVSSDVENKNPFRGILGWLGEFF